ncbi:MAG: RpoL/Rpb11 RNA polymerase subunit family protein [Nanoarchaeota archaeon]
MEVKVLNSSKDAIDLEIGNITIAEILRVYLNKDSAVEFVAWKQDHPTKSPVLKVETKGKTAVKAVKDAVNAIEKDLGKIETDFSKLK